MDATPTWPMKVLIVEDEPTNRKFLVSLVSRFVQEVQEATDGFEALDRIKEFTPDVMITDLSMPRLDGLSLIRELRLQGKKFPILVLSAHNQAGILRTADTLGATEYLFKPVRLAVIEQALINVAKTLGMAPI